MSDWTIGALMGGWLACVIIAALMVMRSNRLTQDACARIAASLERVQVSNNRVEMAYASWRSEAILRQVAPAADDELMSWYSDSQRGPRASATSTTG